MLSSALGNMYVYQSQESYLNNRSGDVQQLLWKKKGFGWDKDTKRFTAPDEVWNDYLQIVSMIQQRWQKEAEEKEAEENVNNVWDEIKEIPDLEENERFDAMNLVHKLGMKAGFMSMTREERFRWIKRSVPKP
ncbi:Myb/SANT-like domain protein [Raphanus sativus]|nr:Myb/SANT-like domain protein [Raphanus sativus]